MAKLLSDQTASELPSIFEAVRNIQQSTRGRPIRRDRGGVGGGTIFGLCTITGENEEKPNKEYFVNVREGNPNDPAPTELPKGVLYLNYSTTNPVSIGAQIMAILYDSTKEVPEGEDPIYTYDCFPIETLYNLVSPPEEEES